MKLIAVFVENRAGQTARITRILADAGVNIAWITIANNGSFGVMKFLVDKLDAAVNALKAQGVMLSLLEVLAVEVPNRPGALQQIADVLSSRGLNLADCSGFISNNRAIVVIEPEELEPAKKVLQEQGFPLVSQEQMHGL